MFGRKKKYYKKTGNIILPVFLLLMAASPQMLFGQRHELGLGVGGFNYVGDINPRFNFLNFRPGGMLFYRYNSPNKYTCLRLSVSSGQLNGDEKRSNDYTSSVRNASFSSTITEMALMGEYNFVNYRDKKQLIKFSPYLTGGVAVFGFTQGTKTASLPELDDVDRINIALPVGFGVKFMINKNWNVSPEFVARKTFTDYLDGISTASVNNRTTGNPIDKDWYFYAGISFSYTFFGVNCPQEYKY